MSMSEEIIKLYEGEFRLRLRKRTASISENHIETMWRLGETMWRLGYVHGLMTALHIEKNHEYELEMLNELQRRLMDIAKGP